MSLNILRSAARGRRLAAFLALGLCASACTPDATPSPSGTGDSGASATSPSAPAVPIALRVVSAFYPLQEAAQRVGGDRVQVTDLTPPGVEPHDLELTPDDVEAVVTADVVLYLGQGFQPAIEDAVKDAEGDATDLLAGLPTRPPPAGTGEEGVEVDPHVWLDPRMYAALVGEVAHAFGTADPAHADFYDTNADAFTRALTALDGEFLAGLTGCRRDTFVTSHAAFGYLALTYGLRQEAISGLSPDAEPSAGRLSELKDLVQREGITTIFTEELVSPTVAETLASEAGVSTAVLNTIEGLTDEAAAAGADYSSLMRENLQALEAALGCR